MAVLRTWTHSIDRPSIIQKLRKINKLAIAMYTMFLRSTPTRAVELLTDTFPLHLRLEKEALCAYIRLAKLLPLTWSGTNKNKRRNVAHRRFWANKVEEYDISALLFETDSCYSLAPQMMFTVYRESFHQYRVYFDQLGWGEWEVFTDGSKRNNRVGAAFIIRRFGLLWQENKYRFPIQRQSFRQSFLLSFKRLLHFVTLR